MSQDKKVHEATVKAPFSQPCFDHFYGPCFRGHDEAGLLAFEALPGSPRLARGTRRLTGTRIYTILLLGSLSQVMIDGVAVGHCGAKVLLFVKAAPVLATLQNLIFRAVKHWPWTLRRCPPQLRRKIAAQL